MNPSRHALAAALALAVSAAGLCAGQEAARPPARPADAVFLPTPDEVVTAMLQMAGVGRGDVVYDLGSGDGRIPIAAVRKFGAARGVGIELDAVRVQEANENARRAGVKDRVQFVQQDLFDTDLSPATVVTLYMGAGVNLRLRPKLMALKPGTRVVSHAFDMGDWPAADTRMVSGRPVFLWRIPER